MRMSEDVRIAERTPSVTPCPAPAAGRQTRQSPHEHEGLARKVWYHTMRANHSIRRRCALCAASAAALSAVMLVSVSCTRHDTADDLKDTVESVIGTSADHGEDKTDTGAVLNPDAGTVSPDADAGDHPAGTDEGRGIRSRFMH